jgi:hypothetical protein
MRINPINFYRRRLNFCPPHFKTTIISAPSGNDTKVDSWIYDNCVGRYSITKPYSSGESIRSKIKIGFEEPSDLTLFALSGLMNQSTQKDLF